MQGPLCKLKINLNESFVVQGWMLQKPHVVSESMYFMVSGDATLHCPSDKGGKPLESLFETVFRAAGVVKPSVIPLPMH